MASRRQPSLLPDGITQKGVDVLVITIVVMFLASISVLLRFMQRRRASVKYDDWTCLASLLVGYCFTISTVLLATIGKAGNHIYQFQNDPEKTTLFIQLYLAADVLAAGSIALAKVSILLFYRRIFAIKRSFSLATWVIGFIVFGWFVSTTCGLLFASNPIEGEWKPWIPHTHINHQAFWIAYGSVNLVLDIVILCLPQPMVWKLNLSPRRKAQLSVVFLLGAFVCVASAVRIWVTVEMDLDDLSYSLMPISIWTVIEMAASIICACLPMMPSFYRDYFGSGSKKNSANTSERTTSLYQRPLKGDIDGTGSSSSQGRLWGEDMSLDSGLTDLKTPLALEDMKSMRVPITH